MMFTLCTFDRFYFKIIFNIQSSELTALIFNFIPYSLHHVDLPMTHRNLIANVEWFEGNFPIFFLFRIQ